MKIKMKLKIIQPEEERIMEINDQKLFNETALKLFSNNIVQPLLQSPSTTKLCPELTTSVPSTFSRL
jgi:hypothetical protein